MTRQILCPQLIGREPELRAIEAALDGVQAGRGAAALILGEAGIGKSRLAREAATAAEERQQVVLVGRCVEGGQIPYRPLIEALLAGIRRLGLPDSPELAPFRPLLGRLIPAWAEHASNATDASAVILGEGILRLLDALARERGCLLVLEDLHWADAETLAVLEYLSDNAADQGLVMLATFRSDEQSAGLTLARALQRRRAVQVLELGRLGFQDVSRMTQTCLGVAVGDKVLAAVISAEGLPLLVEELLAERIRSGALVESGDSWELTSTSGEMVPFNFSETVLRRLRALGDDSSQLLRLASVLGRRFDWSLLPCLSGLSETRVLELLRRALEAQLVVVEQGVSGTEFRFRHALTQAAIQSELLPQERALLSASALEAIVAAHPLLEGDWCELAARLAEDAHDRPRAAQLLLESARRALAQGALASADVALARAHNLCPKGSAEAVEVDQTWLEALALAGKWQQAFELSEGLLARMSGADAQLRRIDIRLRLARAALAAGQWDRADNQLAQAKGLVPTTDHERLARVDGLAALVAIERWRVDEAARLAQAALEATEDGGPPEVACEALEVLGRCARRHDLEEAEAFFERALAIADRCGLTVWRMRALHELGTVDLFRHNGFERLHSERDLAIGSGALADAVAIDIQIWALHEARFELPEALEVAQRAVEAADRFRLEVLHAVALTFLAHTYGLLGERAKLEEIAERAMPVLKEHPDLLAELWGTRASASLIEDDVARAWQDLLAGREAGSLPTTPGPRWGLHALLATFRNEGGEAACEALRGSPALIQPINRLLLAYADAVRLGREGHGQKAEAAVAAAEVILSRGSWYRNYGRRLVAETAITDGWGDPAAWLAESGAFFERHGLLAAASTCRSLLRKTGASSPAVRPHLDVRPDLRTAGVTEREEEVLRLVAEGLSNKEIGERLYISPRTAERHVFSLMNKLGLRTRAQLAAALAAGPR